MAELKLAEGTAIVLADTTDYSPAAANNLGIRTHQVDLTSLGNNLARQTAKFDFGATWDPIWTLDAALEFAATPTAGNSVLFYLAPSDSSTAGNNNPGGVSGSDSSYTGYSSNLDDSLKQLNFLGQFICTAQATSTVQIQMSVADFMPTKRYGSLVIVNQSGAAFHSDMVETAIRLAPIEHQA